ncbi:MAG TPA: hypothetical protein VM888_00740 [Chitinophagaceae bacterium]|nr:hypothetical protein [Chitinophagaceae bacterium]
MKKITISFFTILLLFSCDKASLSFNNSTSYGGVTGQGGSMARFTIVGNYLYTVDKQDLKVFNITDASSPVYTRTVPVGFEIETIYPFQNYLFIGSTSVVHIFNIDDPANPQKTSEAISPTVIRRCDPVVAKDTVAYATLRTNSACGGTQSILAIYDIKNIKAPIQRTSVPVSEPYGLGYKDNVLYVCDRYNGLMLFDITNAFNPVTIKNYKDGEYLDVIPYNNMLICWTTKGMILYDISNNRNPVLLTTII